MRPFQDDVMGQSLPEIQALERAQMRSLPPFRVGDTVRVHYRIREGDKERIQVYQGVVIRRRRGGIGSTFTVRKVSYGVGVERIFPTHSPRIEKIELVSRGHVRQARLYYLRELRGKKARLRGSQRKAGELPSQEELDQLGGEGETPDDAAQAEASEPEATP